MEPEILYADTIPPVYRKRDDELFRIQIEARPEPENTEAAEVGGAYIICWVDAHTLRQAELQAIELIQENGWLPLRIVTWELCCRDCYPPEQRDSEKVRQVLERMDEAFAEGAACIFYCWPVDAPDADEEDEE